MLCSICEHLLHEDRPIMSRSGYIKRRLHHERENDLLDSQRTGCYICHVVSERLTSTKSMAWDQPSGHGSRKNFLTAVRKPVEHKAGLHRLDFWVSLTDERVASFVLKRIGPDDPYPGKTTPVSDTTDHPEVFKIAKGWIEECKKEHKLCRPKADSGLYPTRLLDLEAADLSTNGMPSIVKLVSRKDDEHIPNQPLFEGKYVTMSHKWGSKRFEKLTSKNRHFRFTGIDVKTLSLSFQHAIKFARYLGVRWIWIDALCIIQDSEHDWLQESASMSQVYLNSYCNISATAADDGSQGLFFKRDKTTHWAERVSISSKKQGRKSVDSNEYTISDLDFWTDYVDEAPVNRRSWVFQERILSPRIIHWCKDQVIFECCEANQAECRPPGFPILQTRGKGTDGTIIQEKSYLKGVDETTGQLIRHARLLRESSSSVDRNPGSMSGKNDKPNWQLYEIWQQHVGEYTRKEILDQRDRLIALSGVARWYNQQLNDGGANDIYIAGMWKNYLASHLLWRVNVDRDVPGKLPASNRPKNYRAPSFSWASVETPQGVIFPETNDEGLLAEVQMVRLIFETGKDHFGLITGGYLIIKGLLRQIIIYDEGKDHEMLVSPDLRCFDHRINSVVLYLVLCFACGLAIAMDAIVTLSSLFTGRLLIGKVSPPAYGGPKKPENRRFCWSLLKDGKAAKRRQREVYLDSPFDEPSIFGHSGQVYALPVLEDMTYLHCLLIQPTTGENGIRYKRVGYTRIMREHREDVDSITERPGRNETELGHYYRGEADYDGTSTICII